jgi:trehalose 6-phosphate phosphatase
VTRGSHTDIGPALIEAVRSLTGTPRLLVACDFDGVLAPIVSNPADSRPLPASYDALVQLADLPETEVALISGRALRDLRTLSGAPGNFHLVGSHGSEFDDGEAAGLDERAAHLLERVIDEVHEITAHHPGVIVETKPVSVAVHVRNASRVTAAEVLAAVTGGPARLEGVRPLPGKEVIELAVVDTSKGTALDALREHTGATGVFYAGDDVTDEKAFVRLGDADVGVKVGPGATAAAFRVADPTTLSNLLAMIVEVRRGRVPSVGS